MVAAAFTAVTVAAAAMTVALSVVVAVDGGIIGQLPCQEIGYCCICFSLYAAVELDACLGQGILGTGANAAADKGVDALLLQEGGQCPVPLALRGEDMGFGDFALLDGVDLEFLRVAEVLENLAVFIGDCKFHNDVFSFPGCEPAGVRGGKDRLEALACGKCFQSVLWSGY